MGKLRSRVGGKGNKTSDLAEGAVGDSETLPRSRRWSQWSLEKKLLVVLSVIQAGCLVGFAGYAQHKLDHRVVHILTDDTLPAFVAEHMQGALLYFHTATCVHCKTLSPAFAAAARELSGDEGAPLASVDLSSARAAASVYGVRRVPTLLWFKGGALVADVPPTHRSKGSIVDYVRQALQPALVTLASQADLKEALPQLREALRPKGSPVFIGFPTAERVKDALEMVAEWHRGKTVFIYVMEKGERSPLVQAIYSNPADDKEYVGEVSAEALNYWAQKILR